MRGTIDRHNQLNGQLFSSVEFALITLVTGPFAVYYLTHERLLLALLFGGIAANSVTVVGYAINTMVRSGHGAPAPGTIWNAQARVQLRQWDDRTKRPGHLGLAVATAPGSGHMMCRGPITPNSRMVIPDLDTTDRTIGRVSAFR